MTLLGANPDIAPVGVDVLPGRSHILIGNDPSRWRRNIPQFAKVRYEEAYAGIDLVFYGNHRKLEYDFIVAPEADPKMIRLSFDGAQRLHVDARGDLIMETAAGRVRHRRPRAYQDIDGAERNVASAYDLGRANAVGFRIGDYDKRHPLIIDPVLDYATYLGGNDTELGHSIAVDAEGCAYITGQAVSEDFPRTPGLPEPALLDGETSYAFVTKLNPSGTAIIYSTMFGGIDYDIGNGIEVDSSGAAYVVGETRSGDFPATAQAAQRIHAGDRDAFVAKLSPDGSSLVYATYLGGTNLDLGNGVAIDSSGSAYVTGTTVSDDFPTTPNAYQREAEAGRDVFAAKLSADGSRLLYSTLIGGIGDETSNDIAVDRAGNAYLAGFAETRRANGGVDAYCLKLNPTGSDVVYVRLFGGTGVEEANAVFVDESGNTYLTGITFSKDFPTTPGALQMQSKSPVPDAIGAIGYDAFVVKIDPRGEDLLFGTYLNGSVSASGQAIRLDQQGNVLVAGFTGSEDFPVTAGSFEPPAAGHQFRAFFAKLDPGARQLLYSTRFGGSTLDQAWDMAIDSNGAAYVAGFTVSAEFPVTEDALQPNLAGSFDAFIAKFSAAGPPVVTAAGVVSAASFRAGAIAPGMIVSIFGTGLGPRDSASLELDDDGLVKAQLRGTRVLFNDAPAPLVFVSEGQISAIAPYSIANEATVRITVESGGVHSAPASLSVAASAPALFTYDSSGAGHGAILNQDGSINTAENPAERGSIVVLYGTGEGQTEPAGQDGKIGGSDPTRPQQPVAVTIGGREAEVIFAGGAPGQVAGVIQVNARVPADLEETGEVPVSLQVGSATSQPGVTVALR